MKTSTKPSLGIRPSVCAAALARPHGAEALALLDRAHAEGRGVARDRFSRERFEDAASASLASALLGEPVSVARLRRVEEEG